MSNATPRPRERADAMDLDPLAGGFRGLVGYRLVAWRDGFARVDLEIDERHLNRSAVVHGGVIMTLLDAAAGYSGLHCHIPGNVRRCLSMSLSQLFIAPARPPLLRVEGRLISAAKSTFFAEATAFDAAGQPIASAQGAYRWAPGSESADGVPEEGGQRR